MNIQFFPIANQDLVFLNSNQEVFTNCQRGYNNHPNGCPNFNHNWSCPPYAPSIQEIKKIIPMYEFWWILSIKISVSSFVPKIFQSRHLKHLYRKYTRYFNEFLDFIQQQHSKWKIFFCSECKICKERLKVACNCPHEPCRFPKEIRISPEAVGINLFESLAKISHPLNSSPKKSLHRIALVGTHKKIDFNDEFEKYLSYQSMLKHINTYQ